MNIMDILRKAARLWSPPLLTGIGTLMLGMWLLKLFDASIWYLRVAGAFMIVGTVWWSIKAIKNR